MASNIDAVNTNVNGNDDTSDDKSPESKAKLFIGQIPKTVDEDELKPLFEEFGPVQEVYVIRDRSTGASKGCAFVTYSEHDSAIACINALHNNRIMPPMQRPLQVKFAGQTVDPSEYKLFIGMLPRDCTEEQLLLLFSPYGDILEAAILRNPATGTSRGCGFIKYKLKEEAEKAIASLNEKYKMEGMGSALVVKFADVDKKHDHQRMPQQQMVQSEPIVNNQPPPPYWLPQVYNPYRQYAPQQSNSRVNQSQSQHMQPAVKTRPPPPVQQQLQQQQQQQSNDEHRQQTNQVTGPPGANLFVYRIPQYFTDQDLAATFMPFGNVISAKVFVDKATGQRFVSYDSADAAVAAIAGMNGFQIADRKLKVELKKTDK